MSFRKIALGTAAMSFARFARLLVQFVAIPILARILTPADYGLVAIAMPFALFAMMLADAGIGMSLVRTPVSDRLGWSTSFWLSTALGVAFAALMALAAPVAAAAFDAPLLTPLIASLSFVVIAQAVHLIPIAALQQASRFGAIAFTELASTAAGIGCALYFALAGAGAWALIAQQIGFFAVRVVLVCWLSPFRPLWVFDWPAVRSHVRFGRDVLGVSLVSYFSRSADNWVVAKALGSSAVGLYSMAFQFARLPIQLVSGPLQYVVYAELARMNNDRTAIARVFMTATRVVALLVFPFMGLTAIAGEQVFAALLSAKWSDAGLLFALVAPACAVQTVAAIGDTVVYALGRTDLQLRASIEYAAVWLTALIAAVWWGFVAAAVCYTVCSLLYQLRYFSMILPVLGLRRRDYLRAYAIPCAATAAGMLVYAGLARAFAMPGWFHVVLVLGVAALAVLGGGLAQSKSLAAELRNLRVPATGR
jgi:O-antigen/teichoic acid export membrane protein